MNKKTIILIACIAAVILIIAFAIFFTVRAQKSNNSEHEQKIVITKYNENFDIEKTIEVTNKKDIREIEKISKNVSLEQDEESKYLGIRNDVKVDLGNEKYFMIQLDLKDYCYYEDPASDIELVIKMPDGLLDKVNNILSENK